MAASAGEPRRLDPGHDDRAHAQVGRLVQHPLPSAPGGIRRWTPTPSSPRSLAHRRTSAGAWSWSDAYSTPTNPAPSDLLEDARHVVAAASRSEYSCTATGMGVVTVA